jgi:hypothetical protein
MNPKRLKRLLKLLNDHGVTSYHDSESGVEITLSPKQAEVIDVSEIIDRAEERNLDAAKLKAQHQAQMERDQFWSS